MCVCVRERERMRQTSMTVEPIELVSVTTKQSLPNSGSRLAGWPTPKPYVVHQEATLPKP